MKSLVECTPTDENIWLLEVSRRSLLRVTCSKVVYLRRCFRRRLCQNCRCQSFQDCRLNFHESFFRRVSEVVGEKDRHINSSFFIETAVHSTAMSSLLPRACFVVTPRHHSFSLIEFSAYLSCSLPSINNRIQIHRTCLVKNNRKIAQRAGSSTFFVPWFPHPHQIAQLRPL